MVLSIDSLGSPSTPVRLISRYWPSASLRLTWAVMQPQVALPYSPTHSLGVLPLIFRYRLTASLSSTKLVSCGQKSRLNFTWISFAFSLNVWIPLFGVWSKIPTPVTSRASSA